MKKLFIIICLLPQFAHAQAIKGYNDYVREDARFKQEQEMRQLQIERLRAGQAEDPVIAQSLREADARRGQQECRVERTRFNGTLMSCKVCPGKDTVCTY